MDNSEVVRSEVNEPSTEINGLPAPTRQIVPLKPKGDFERLPHRSEIDTRLHYALQDAGHSALGMPSSVDTIKAMLARAGLALVLA